MFRVAIHRRDNFSAAQSGPWERGAAAGEVIAVDGRRDVVDFRRGPCEAAAATRPGIG